MHDSTRLEAQNLGKRFGARILFRDLSFAVRGGESLAVTGANGAGKSTLLRILAGVLTATSGEVLLFEHGDTVQRERHPLRIGLVAPYLNAYDAFSPRENLHFIGRARRLSNSADRIVTTLRDVGLSERMDDPVATFSSGMKQRVKFAVALLPHPAVLLLDEPRVNLDRAGLEMVGRLTERHLTTGGIVVVATNDFEEARRYDRILQIEDFRRNDYQTDSSRGSRSGPRLHG